SEAHQESPRHNPMRMSQLAALAVLVVANVALAESAPVGTAKIVSGTAMVVRGGEKTPLKVGDPIMEHDVFETVAAGRLGITFNDNTSSSIGLNSHVSIDT